MPSADAVLAAPLLGRGWSDGITLSAGEAKTVPVAMYAKGTIVTVCGAPASGGSGTPGDNTADGILAVEAYLGNPIAVKAGPDDAIYVSSSAFRKVKRIDRYGYLSNFAGDGTHGTITPGAPAASAPIGAVQDIDVDPAGNLYLFNDFNQIVRVDNGVVNKLVYDNGVANSVGPVQPRRRERRPRLLRELPGEPGLPDDRHVEIRLRDGQPAVRHDGAVRSVQLSAACAVQRSPTRPTTDSLIFADTDNDRIMRLSFADLNIHFLVANAAGTRFSEGVDPLAMAPLKPRVVDYNPITGKIFFVEGVRASRVLVYRCCGESAFTCRHRSDWVLRRRRPRNRRRIERPAGDRGRLPRQRLYCGLRQPRRPDGRRRRPALIITDMGQENHRAASRPQEGDAFVDKVFEAAG